MTKFSKGEKCPTSEVLNAFEQGEISVAEGGPIRQHLRVCEFCAAESDFYAKFPQPLEIEPVQMSDDITMPQPLRELAETLLNKNRGSSALEALIENASKK